MSNNNLTEAKGATEKQMVIKMAIYKILNAAFQVICYQIASCKADAIISAKAEGFSAQYVEFVKMASFDDSDEQYTNA